MWKKKNWGPGRNFTGNQRGQGAFGNVFQGVCEILARLSGSGKASSSYFYSKSVSGFSGCGADNFTSGNGGSGKKSRTVEAFSCGFCGLAFHETPLHGVFHYHVPLLDNYTDGRALYDVTGRTDTESGRLRYPVSGDGNGNFLYGFTDLSGGDAGFSAWNAVPFKGNGARYQGIPVAGGKKLS